MAQVCIDSKIFTDTRFKALARNLKISLDDAIGKSLRVWHCCIQSEKCDLSASTINDCVDHADFAKEMLNAGLARMIDPDKEIMYIAGTKGRLERRSELFPKSTGLKKPEPKKVSPPVIGTNEIIALYHDEFLKLYRTKWKPDGKSLGLAKGIVKDFGIEETRRLVKAYFEIKRQDIVRKHHDWGTFKLNLNLVQVQADRGRIVGTEESKTIERSSRNISAAQNYLETVREEGNKNEAG